MTLNEIESSMNGSLYSPSFELYPGIGSLIGTLSPISCSENSIEYEYEYEKKRTIF